MSIVHNGREKKLFTIILALRKGLKALFEALHGSSIKGGGGGGGGVAGVLRTSPSNCKAHVKLSSRRVLKGETKVLVKIRAQMATKIPPLGLVMECKMCSSMPLIKCCLWGKRSRSGQVSLKEERQMYGEISCKRFILVTGRRFWTICSRGEERWLLSPAGTAACKRDLNPHLLELICVS